MAESPATRASLLVRIRDSRDGPAWSQFVDLYAPLIYNVARKRGLQDADAADLTQDVLRAVAGAVGGFAYDPQRGSFRGWLFTVACNKLRNFQAARRRQISASGDPAVNELLAEQPDPHEEQALWDREYEKHLFDWAAEQVRADFEETTWQAFWQTAVEDKSPKDVAKELGVSVGAVYIAKSRVLARLKEKISEVTNEGDSR